VAGGGGLIPFRNEKKKTTKEKAGNGNNVKGEATREQEKKNLTTGLNYGMEAGAIGGGELNLNEKNAGHSQKKGKKASEGG